MYFEHSYATERRSCLCDVPKTRVAFKRSRTGPLGVEVSPTILRHPCCPINPRHPLPAQEGEGPRIATMRQREPCQTTPAQQGWPDLQDRRCPDFGDRGSTAPCEG